MSINSANLPCPSCRTMNQLNARFCLNCGASLAKGDQTPYQPPASHQAPPMAAEFLYAGFWKRFFAYLIDGIIINFLMFLVVIWGLGKSAAMNDPTAMMSSISLYFFGYYLVVWMYFALLESSSKQATIGKRALGIKVTDLAGQPLSFMHAAGRQLAGVVSSMTFLIGYLMAAITGRKQALHDMIASAVVVNKNFGPNQIALVNQSPPAGMSVAGVIGIVFLVLFIPVGGILAAIAIPAYQDYTVRAQISEARVQTGNARTAIINYASETGYWPSNFEQAGVSSASLKTDSYYAQIIEDGVLLITFKRPEILDGKTLSLTPDLNESGDYEWYCRSNDIKNVQLPADCRD